jgi:NAD(P)-dependent dehydrogenase (short-subunit alcohol dehydrogenase family)
MPFVWMCRVAKLDALEGEVHFHHCDVSNYESAGALASTLGGDAIDLLINNAATFAPDGPGALELPAMDEFTRVMRVNTVGPIYMAEVCADSVSRSDSRIMAFISTRSGPIWDNTSGGHYAYRCSKVSLNMAVKSLSFDLKSRGVISVALHPGSV